MERRDPHPIVMQCADRLDIQASAPHVGYFGDGPPAPFPWFYAGSAPEGRTHVIVRCEHASSIPSFSPPPPVRMTDRTMADMRAADWRVSRPSIPRPPREEASLAYHQFVDGRSREFGLYVGQCPDCGRIVWMDATP